MDCKSIIPLERNMDMNLKKITALMIILLLTFSAFGCGKQTPKSGEGDLTVYTSFYVMYDFAKKIGGDKAEVINMVPAGTEPHDWEPSAADIAGLERADIFIYNGKGMEHWTEDVLKTIGSNKLITVEASAGIEDVQGDHSDPHVWLSPMNAKKQMENIKDAFAEADPENAEYYEANFSKYSAELDALDAEFKSVIEPLPRRDIVVSHEAFGYLCKAYGLRQIAVEGLSPDSEPDAARVSDIIRFIKENNVKVIFFESLSSAKVAQTISANSGAKAEVLNPLEGLTDEEIKNGEDYFSVMRKNLAALKNALE
jgi:zinc transport system substrate-binding protein